MSNLLSSTKRLISNVRSFAQPNQVGFLILYVTNRCNFSCNFCFYSSEIQKGKKSDELTIEEITAFSKKLGPLLQLSLTGGEPFLRERLADIARLFLINNHVRFLTIPTNAWFTDRIQSFVEDIVPEFPHTRFRICLSVDGVGAHHDQNRSKEGSYEKLCATYAALSPLRNKFPNLVLDANTVFTARTEPVILDIMKTLLGNFSFDNLSVTYARGHIPSPQLQRISRAKYEAAIDFLEAARRTRENGLGYPIIRALRDVSRRDLSRIVFENAFVHPCVAGRKLVVVSETGEVLPCEILGKSFGNLRQNDFDIHKVLAAPSSKKLVSGIVDSKCKCSFECALAANLVWNFKSYPRILQSAVKNLGKDRPQIPIAGAPNELPS